MLWFCLLQVPKPRSDYNKSKYNFHVYFWNQFVTFQFYEPRNHTSMLLTQYLGGYLTRKVGRVLSLEKKCRLRLFSCSSMSSTGSVFSVRKVGESSNHNEKSRFGFSVLKNTKVFRITNVHEEDIAFGSCIRSRWYTTASKESAVTATTKERVKFKVIDGPLDTSNASFQQRLEYSKTLEENHNKLTSFARSGGGKKALERHTKVNKKLFVRDRLRLLLDAYCDNTFLEIGTLAGFGMPYGDIPCASTVIGIGKIHGTWCAISANDGTVKGGTMYPIGVKKQLRLQEIGLHNRLPCVYVVDSGGAFLPLQAEIFADKEHGGKTFANEAIFSALKIPQIAIVCGSCTAGGAYVPTMCDEAVMVDKIGTIFLGGPPLVRAATGEIVSAEDLGGATLHCKVSGCTDHFAANEEEAFDIGRDIVASLNANLPLEPERWNEPLYNTNELPGIDPATRGSMKKIIARLTDGSRFHEFKTMYGPTLVTGMAFIKGHLVGIVGSDGALTANAATKGAHFVELCCHRQIPLIFLQNLPPEGSIKDIADGASMGDAIRARSKMMTAVACAKVPKITVIVGDSFGPSNFAMCGRAFSPRFLFMWPSARIGISSEQEAATQFEGVESDSDEPLELDPKMGERYNRQVSALYSSGRLWDDGIILPQHTRQVLGMCLSITSQQREEEHTKFGVFRM